MIPGVIVVIVFGLNGGIKIQMCIKKQIFINWLHQILQPVFSLWAIMNQPRVITSFQSLCGIGLMEILLF